MHLWDFALTAYDSDAVKQLCLRLQDEFEVDVCLLLGLCWITKSGQLLAHDNRIKLLGSVEDWQRTKTQVIRNMRRRIKCLMTERQQLEHPFLTEWYAVLTTWYEALLKLELQSEQFALNHIEKMMVDHWRLVGVESTAWLPMEAVGLEQNVGDYLRTKAVPQEDIEVVLDYLLKL